LVTKKEQLTTGSGTTFAALVNKAIQEAQEKIAAENWQYTVLKTPYLRYISREASVKTNTAELI
jgi:hypothetical protein